MASSPSRTEAKKSPLSGRGLFATESHAPGDVILALDRPLVAALDKLRIEDTCSWCFSWTELPVLSGAGVNQATEVHWCTGCKKVKYCSKTCQSRAWKARHKRECKMFAIQPELIPSVVIAVMQMVDGIMCGDQLSQELLGMETHRDEFEKAGGKKWESMQLMAHTASKFMGLKENTTHFQATKTAMCMVMCNSSRLVTPTFDPLGLCLDPRITVVNHACNPNAVVTMDGPRLTLRALEPLKPDTEILISYIDSSAPFSIRQAELRDRWFFTCSCAKCTLGAAHPREAFLPTNEDFSAKISVIDSALPTIETDAAWPRHYLGPSLHEKRLAALQFYGYSFLQENPDNDAEQPAADPDRLRKGLMIIRNAGVVPLTRAPLPALFQHYAVACLAKKRYNEALIALLRLHMLIDPTVYPQRHHPVRVVHAWTLATLAKAVGSDQDAPFCQALRKCGVDLSMLFVGLLMELREQVAASHGAQSLFGRMVEGAWQTMMEPGGELDVQYQQMGIGREQWGKVLAEQMSELWPKVKAFVEDEELGRQIDEALVESSE